MSTIYGGLLVSRVVLILVTVGGVGYLGLLTGLTLVSAKTSLGQSFLCTYCPMPQDEPVRGALGIISKRLGDISGSQASPIGASGYWS